MKATELTLFATLACAPLACGQGRFTFNNTSVTLISTNAVHSGSATGPTAPFPGSGAPQFVYGLFAAPSTVTTVSGVTDANWTFTGAYATNTTSATGGRLFGVAAGYAILSPPYGVGTTFSFLVRGWSSTIGGQDWATVQGFMHNFEVDPNASGSLGQFFGTSSIATLVVGGSPGLPDAVLFGTTPGVSIQGFTLDQIPIPEPSSFALAVVGLALLCGRRLYRVRK